jgi:hypothetical protein
VGEKMEIKICVLVMLIGFLITLYHAGKHEDSAKPSRHDRASAKRAGRRQQRLEHRNARRLNQLRGREA